jgi:hypothetical protein
MSSETIRNIVLTIKARVKFMRLNMQRMSHAWRDGLLNYILEGTRQFEWNSASLTSVSGFASMLTYALGNVPPQMPESGRYSIIGVSAIHFALGAGLILALIRDDRRLRCEFSKWIALAWLARGAATALANFSFNPGWVVGIIYSLFFAAQSAIAYFHNSLVIQEGEEK